MNASQILAVALAAAPTACAPPDDAEGGTGSDSGAPFVQPGADDPSARPFVKAGSWYPEDPDELDAEVDALLEGVGADAPRTALAVLAPHASLGMSGPTAAQLYARVEIPDRVIVLAPDHWGDGEPVAIWTDGPWLVPGHAIAIDDALVADLREALPELVPDRVAFENHEEEMQLPFLQQLHPEVTLAGIAITDNSRIHFQGFDLERIDAWGRALAQLITDRAAAGERILLLTTTDLSHRETEEDAERIDAEILAFVEALDVEGLHAYVTTQEISMCGEIVTAIMMATLRELGRDSMEVLAQGSSTPPVDLVGYPAAAAWE